MKVSVIIPTTGERPQFVDHALRMVSRQTYRDNIIETTVVQNADKTRPTLVENVRKGYEEAEGDLVVIWEDDDYYRDDYIETMVKSWEPGLEVLGVNHSTYYHLGALKLRTMIHPDRSSLMNTVLKAKLTEIPWDGDIFLDMRIWKAVHDKVLKGKLINEQKAIGLKHGIGRSGGRAHDPDFFIPNKSQDDPDMNFLRGFIGDREILAFYLSIHERIKSR